MNSVEQFRDAIRAAGMVPPDHIEPGRFHRFAGIGKRNGNTSGWCKLFADERGGVFGDYSSDFADHWQAAHEGPAPTPTERAAFRQRIEGARAEAEAARRAEHAEAATRAAATWQAAQPAPADHGYLVRKGIKPHGTRVADDGRIVLPVRVAGEITSLQFIDADGGKRFLPGGRVAGGYYAIGNPDGAAALCIVEGFATGASIHEATVLPVAIAFNAGNLGAVAQAMRQRFPGLPLVVCGDDDYRTEGNPGTTKAREAACAVGAGVALPCFGDDRPEGGSDFNDVAQARGLDVVREQIRAAIPRPKSHDGPPDYPEIPDDDPGADPPSEEAAGVEWTDFYCVLPQAKYLYTPTRELWPPESVSAKLGTKERKRIDKARAVVQMTWHPSEPLIVPGRVVADGGWVPHDGVSVANLYRAPVVIDGDARQAGRWRDHLRNVYPGEADHIEYWLAHRVQRPGEKLNHALVLGGEQGIGKDTLLEPAKHGVGPWNWSEITPSQMLGRFNGWAKSVVVRVSEARDLGDVDRFAFYDHSKVYIAAPPDVIRVDEKNLREHAIFNVMGIILTTNHKTDGIYLPLGDRRHFVAWSDRVQGDFDEGYWTGLWSWYATGGLPAVASFLRSLDLATFNPKAPPPKTPAFFAIVAANSAPEDGELRDVIERAGHPDVLVLQHVVDNARAVGLEALAMEFEDRGRRRAVPHKMERAGYVPVRNPDADDGLFKIAGRRQVVYARRSLSVADQVRAARGLGEPRSTYGGHRG